MGIIDYYATVYSGFHLELVPGTLFSIYMHMFILVLSLKIDGLMHA